jgi:hypothetical protein
VKTIARQVLGALKAATKGITISLPLEAREMFAEALTLKKLQW